MNQYQILKKTVAVALIAAACVGLNATAEVDLASGSELHADISSLVVAAKSKLAEAASLGDVNAAKEAASRSQLIDDAMAKATAAIAALEKALNEGNDDAAESAFEALQKSGAAAIDAITGPLGDTGTASNDDDDDDDEEEPKLANIFDKLIKTDAEREILDGMIQDLYDASGSQLREVPATRT